MASTRDSADDDDDDFFGTESDEDRLAERESQAADLHVQNAAFLDAFDEHKENRLQEGFESGYREVFELASRLGEQLGQISANAKLRAILPHPDEENKADNHRIEVMAQDMARRYRAVMSDINAGTVSNADAKQQLLDLEVEVSRR